MYSNLDAKYRNIFLVPEIFLQDNFKQRLDQDAASGELQYIFISDLINIVGGMGYFDIKNDTTFTDELFDTSTIPPTPIDVFSALSNGKTHHTNAYLYLYVKYPKKFIFTFGGGVDIFDAKNTFGEGTNIEENRFNPKFGILWNPFVSTTVRAAVFSTLKRTLITNQTLEPTQVAGFNQFFDDANGTKTWVYGIAVDQKITKSFYGGVEYSYRDLNTPGIKIPPPPAEPVPQLDSFDWKEYLGRAYLNWTPHEWLALRAEYQYEKFNRDSEWTFGIKEVKTHRVPLGMGFYHPFGLSAYVQATYYDQSGDFNRVFEPSFTVFESGDDQFWLADATISYRLPQRYGFISVGAKNLFDKSFRYYDTNPVNPAIQPDRMFFARVTLSY
jgi:hypothetical protein